MLSYLIAFLYMPICLSLLALFCYLLIYKNLLGIYKSNVLFLLIMLGSMLLTLGLLRVVSDYFNIAIEFNALTGLGFLSGWFICPAIGLSNKRLAVLTRATELTKHSNK